MVRRGLFVGAVIGVVAACSLPSSNEFATTPKDAGSSSSSSGTVSDSGGAPTSEAGTADGDASTADDASSVVNVLLPVDSTFDNGKCGQASGTYQATLTPSSTARSGPDACQVCRTGASASDPSYSLDTQLDVKPKAGQQYTATAYVRAVPNAGDTQDLTLTLRTFNNGNFKPVDQLTSPEMTLTGAYQLITVVLDIKTDTTGMDYYIGSQPPLTDTSACFLIDDVTIWRSK